MDLDLLWYRGDSVNRSGRDTGGRIDGLWTLDTGYWILDCGEGPSPPRGEGARGRAGRCFRGMVLVPAEERPSHYAAVVLRNSRSVVSKSMCLSTGAHILYSGPAGQISKQST